MRWTVKVRDFADQNYELDDKAAKRLFDHIWKQVKGNRHLNVEIDLSQIQSVTRRFERELGYLRRQLRPQGRLARFDRVNLRTYSEKASVRPPRTSIHRLPVVSQSKDWRFLLCLPHSCMIISKGGLAIHPSMKFLQRWGLCEFAHDLTINS